MCKKVFLFFRKVLDNGRPKGNLLGMAITPKGNNPALVSPESINAHLASLSLEDALVEGFNPTQWSNAVRSWVAGLDCSETERANAFNGISLSLARHEAMRDEERALEEEENDGQPDWAQEWHDFDPDC